LFFDYEFVLVLGLGGVWVKERKNMVKKKGLAVILAVVLVMAVCDSPVDSITQTQHENGDAGDTDGDTSGNTTSGTKGDTTTETKDDTTDGTSGDTKGGNDPEVPFIDPNAINRNAVRSFAGENLYQDNAFIGGQWQVLSTNGEPGGYGYYYRTDGTVSSAHHCGVKFHNQFSYVLYKNYLVMFGSETMTEAGASDGDRLEFKTLHVVEDAGGYDEAIFAFNYSAAGTFTGYDVYVRTGADDDRDNNAWKDRNGTAPSAPLLGVWISGAAGRSYEFKGNGTYTVTESGGGIEYRYLVRGGTLITLTPGETTGEGGEEAWTVRPVLIRETFTITGDTLTLGGVSLTKE
jgi:hypothetical protein